MNIEDTQVDMVTTDAIKNITAEAAKLGIIDPSTNEDIQNNLEIIIRDPSSASKLSKELFAISENPQGYALEITEKLEIKAKDIIL